MPWPTNLYPALLYGGTRVEAEWPATAAQPQYTTVKAANVSGSGKTETLVQRQEEAIQVAVPVEGGHRLREWRDYAYDWGQWGRQAELMLDLYTGARLTFANTVADEANGLPCSFSLAATYATVGGKRGLVWPGSGALTVANPAGSMAAAVVGSGGCLVVTWVPSATANQSGTQTVFDTGSLAGGLLTLALTGSCQLDFAVTFPTGSKATARWAATSWAPGVDVVTAVARWSQAGSPALWVGRNGALSQASLYPETQVGSLGTLANTLYLHGDRNGGTPMMGVGLLAATYRYPYDDPTVLASHMPLGRNYWPTAELTDAGFSPGRTAPSLDQWQVAMTFRLGK